MADREAGFLDALKKHGGISLAFSSLEWKISVKFLFNPIHVSDFFFVDANSIFSM
jgi:hypothetical protein